MKDGIPVRELIVLADNGITYTYKNVIIAEDPKTGVLAIKNEQNDVTTFIRSHIIMITWRGIGDVKENKA